MTESFFMSSIENKSPMTDTTVMNDLSQSFGSFKQMMESYVSLMRYSPTEATWHIINHFLPCIGLRPYCYSPEESLKMCDRICELMCKQTMLRCDDLFLIGQYKTLNSTRDKKNLKRKRPRQVCKVAVQVQDDKVESEDSMSESCVSDNSQVDASPDIDTYAIWDAAWDSCSDDERNENANGDNCLVNPWQDPADLDLLSKATETPDVSLDDA